MSQQPISYVMLNCNINNKASVIIQISPLLGELLTINLAQNLPKT